MDVKRLALAAVVAWVADAVYAMVVWMGLLGPEMARHVGVFRSEAEMNGFLPLMFGGGLLAMFVLAYIYSKGYEGRSGVQEGLRFGLLLGVFMTAFVSIPIYGSFNIDARLGMMASVVSFVEMLVVGTAIGVAYRPAAARVGA